MSRAGRRRSKKKKRSGGPAPAAPEVPAAPDLEPRRPRLRVLRWACVIGPLTLMLLLAWTPGISFTEDLGRHILLGRIISEQGSVPTTNFLTYTHPEFPFLNHHWLSEVFFYQLHRFVGLNGLIVWKMIVMVLALGLALTTFEPRRGLGLYWLAGILSAVILGFRSHIRPELVSYLGIAVYLWSFERIRRGSGWPRWMIAGFALLWANSHIYFLFGIGMAGAFWIERVLVERSRSSFWREGAWFAALVAVSCIGPNGLDGFLYPFQIFSNYSFNVLENGPFQDLWAIVVNPMLIALPLLSTGVIAALVMLWRARREGEAEPRLADLIIALAALGAAWTMVRSTPLLALAALPLIAAALRVSSRNEVRGGAQAGMRVRRGFSWATAALALLVNLSLIDGLLDGWYVRVFPSPIGPTPLGFEDEHRFERLRELAARFPLRGPVYSDFKIGSLVEYQLYPEPGYVDNRPEAFPGPFWRTEYYPSLKLGKEWTQIRDKRGFNTVIASLVGAKEFFIQELNRRPDWVLVHLDDLAAVFVRNDDRNAEFIAQSAFTPARIDAYEETLAERIEALSDVPWWRRQLEAKWAVHGVYSLICIGEYTRAWPHLWKLHQRYPDYQIVHELMRVSVPEDEVDRVRPILESRARWPLAAKQVLDWARDLLARGELVEARRVLVRGRFFFPLSEKLRKKVAEIDDRLYLRERASSAGGSRQSRVPAS